MANTSCRVQPADDIFKDYAMKNYRLGPGSFAINAGPRLEPHEIAAAGVDLDGRPRVIESRMDHGCYESLVRGTLLMVR